MPRPALTAALLLVALIGAPLFADNAPPTPQVPPGLEVERAQRPAIAWRDIDVGINEAIAREQVLVVYFTAPWCGWCTRMEQSTFADPRVAERSAGFVWTKIDIDRHPDIAAIFGVRGVPHVALLNARGELLDSQPGFIPPERFLVILAEQQDKAMAPGALREQITAAYTARASLAQAQTPEELAEAIPRALQSLAKMNRQQREPMVHAIAAKGSAAHPMLVETLAAERLALRAAAAEVLKLAAGPDAPPFDPFAETDTRAGQIAAWRAWLQRDLDSPRRSEEGEVEAAN
jgi:thioredoxin 1